MCTSCCIHTHWLWLVFSGASPQPHKRVSPPLKTSASRTCKKVLTAMGTNRSLSTGASCWRESDFSGSPASAPGPDFGLPVTGVCTLAPQPGHCRNALPACFVVKETYVTADALIVRAESCEGWDCKPHPLHVEQTKASSSPHGPEQLTA